MLCKCYWIVLYIVHVTAFCLGGGRFFPDTVYIPARRLHRSAIVVLVGRANPLIFLEIYCEQFHLSLHYETKFL